MSRRRNWCFTDNNPSADDGWHTDDSIRYAVWQLELGASATYHWQGYVEFNKAVSLQHCKRILPNAHWETRLGSSIQASNYCKKEDTRIAGPWEHGTPGGDQGKRADLLAFRDSILEGRNDTELYNDHIETMARYPNLAGRIRRAFASGHAEDQTIVNLRDWQHTIMILLEHEPDPRKIHWYWDTGGNVGKTALAKHILSTKNAFYSNGGKHADILFAYQGEPIILFDFPRTAEEFICYSVIEALKNGIVTISKYESTTFKFPTPHILIFANFEPERTKLSQDRWAITEINPLH